MRELLSPIIVFGIVTPAYAQQPSDQEAIAISKAKCAAIIVAHSELSRPIVWKVTHFDGGKWFAQGNPTDTYEIGISFFSTEPICRFYVLPPRPSSAKP